MKYKFENINFEIKKLTSLALNLSVYKHKSGLT